MLIPNGSVLVGWSRLWLRHQWEVEVGLFRGCETGVEDWGWAMKGKWRMN